MIIIFKLQETRYKFCKIKLNILLNTVFTVIADIIRGSDFCQLSTGQFGGSLQKRDLIDYFAKIRYCGHIMDIEKEINKIQARNIKVEANKAWETSQTRRWSIFLITYVIAVIWLYSIGESGYLLKAFVPALGWLLSTMTLPFIKNIWLKKRNK